MIRDRVALLSAGLALVGLVLLVAVDVAVPPGHAVLTSLFALSPLIACAVMAGCSFLPIPNDLVRAAVAGVAFLVVMTALKGWPFDVPALLRSGRTRLMRKKSA